MAAAPGTIPALPSYQPGALTITGAEILEIASSTNATTATSGYMSITDLVGKAPSAMPQLNPSLGDLIACYSGANKTPFATQIGNLGVASGNLPVGGTVGQVFIKNSGVNFDASFGNLSSQLSASTGISIAGSTAVTLALATTTPLSVLGVAGTATTNPLPIVGTGAQVLRLNDAGTAVGFGAINLASAAAVTGTLPLIDGGLGTNVLGTHGVFLGQGAGAPKFALPAVGGNLLIDQGASADPSFVAVTGDIAINAAGVATVGNNAITLAKFNQGTGLSVLGVASTATANFTTIVGAAKLVLAVNSAGTTVLWQTVSLTIDSALSTTQGAILYRNAATWVALAPGTNGQVLQTQGAAANPQWVGGMVLLNTLTPSNVASTNDTTSLTSTYRNYMVTFENVCPVTQTTTLQMLIATSGSNFVSAASYVSLAQILVSSTFATDTSTSAILLSGTRATTQLQTSTSYGLHGFITLFNPASITFRKMFVGKASWLTPGASGTTTAVNADLSGYWDGTNNAVTGLNFQFNSGNIQTGTIRIYGMF